MTKSFTDLSFLSASTLCLKFSTARLKLKVLLNSKLLNQISERHTNAMIRVDLKMLLGCHVPHRGGVPQSLSLHDPFHVGSPAILRKKQNKLTSALLKWILRSNHLWRDDAARGGHKSVGDNNLLDLLVQNVLHHLHIKECGELVLNKRWMILKQDDTPLHYSLRR